MNWNIIQLGSVDSTNSHASRFLADHPGADNIVIRADFQESGRGDGGNTWESEAGSNLLLTLVVRPEGLEPSMQFMISRIAALAVHDIVSACLPKENADVAIKWPNDIYCSRLKIAGILIQHTILGDRIDNSIIGIGLNVNQVEFSPSLPNPVSLRSITGSFFDVGKVFEEFLRFFTYWFDLLMARRYNVITGAYHHRMFRMNREQAFIVKGEKLTAIVRGTSETGFLILETGDGRILCDESDVVFEL